MLIIIIGSSLLYNFSTKELITEWKIGVFIWLLDSLIKEVLLNIQRQRSERY